MNLMLAALAGCTEPEPVDPGPTVPDPSTEPTDPLDPSPWDFEPDEPPAGAVDLAAVGRAVDAAVIDVLSYDPRVTIDPYLSALAQSSTPTCPPIAGDGYGNSFWVGYCGAPDGAYFGGYLSHYAYRDFADPDFVLNGDVLGGVITVTNVAGDTLDLEGDVQWLEGTSHDGTTELVSSYIYGGFAWDGPAPGWLADGRRSVALALTAIRIPILDADLMIISGSTTVEVDSELWSVSFPDNHVYDEVIGSVCNLEPGGSVEVRDPAGRWIDIEFQGPVLDVDPGDAAECDGCGNAFVDGEPIGQVCADFSPWLAWEALR